MQSDYSTMREAADIAGRWQTTEEGADCILVPMTKKQLALLCLSAALVGLTVWSEDTPSEVKELIQSLTFDGVEEYSTEEEFINMTLLPLNAQPASSDLCPVPDSPEDTAAAAHGGFTELPEYPEDTVSDILADTAY